MEPYDIERCLESMSVIVDTREQPSARAMSRYHAFGVPFRRQKLDFGDYTFNFCMNDKEFISEDATSPKPAAVIERKASLEELSGNLAQHRKRFIAELDRAKENNASVYLLIEDSSIDDVISGNYKTHFNSTAFFHTLTSLQARYGIKLIFCNHRNSGTVIKEILYRELKTRLERGDYG